MTTKFTNLGMAGLALAACTSCENADTKRDAKAPNVIIVFADDLGYGDLGCFGSENIQTPHLDQMANEGVKFTNFYVSQAVSGASRASLLTGCYSNRIGLLGAPNPFARHGINENETTIAELVKQKEYSTAIFGKWHLGHEKKFLPTNHGFDEYYGIPYSNDMWPNHPEKMGFPPLPMIEGTHMVDTITDQSMLTTQYTERAVDFIKKNHADPFLLYVAHSMPHVPLAVSDKFKGKSEQGLYGDVIMEIDWSVGEILGALKDHHIDDNTLVIFTSDNGPWLSYGNHAGTTGPLREGKGTAWDGGQRVPCIMWWPETIPAGSQCATPAMTIDLLPTIADLAQAELPERKIDGKTILPLIKGESDQSPHEAYYFYYGEKLNCVLKDDWKLHLPHGYRTLNGRDGGKDGQPALYDYVYTDTVLYNLKNDIGENTDLKDRYPEIVKDLAKHADSMRMILGDSDMQGSEIRKRGYIDGYTIDTIHIDHLAKDKNISLKNRFTPRYSGGGSKALVDGVLATSDFRDGHWQGYQQNDLIATIDLKKVNPISSVSFNYYEDKSAWIFPPQGIEIQASIDGRKFIDVKTVSKEDILTEKPFDKNEIRLSLNPINVRYIKIRVKNMGLCPKGHPGEGKPAWLFVDELYIR